MKLFYFENPVRLKLKGKQWKTMEKCKLIFSEELNPIEKFAHFEIIKILCMQEENSFSPSITFFFAFPPKTFHITINYAAKCVHNFVYHHFSCFTSVAQKYHQSSATATMHVNV